MDRVREGVQITLKRINLKVVFPRETLVIV